MCTVPLATSDLATARRGHAKSRHACQSWYNEGGPADRWLDVRVRLRRGGRRAQRLHRGLQREIVCHVQMIKTIV